MAASKQAQQLARQLFKLSFDDGKLTSERVQGVLGYVEKTKLAQPLAVLKLYLRLISAEVARSNVSIEHAGAITPATIQSIAASLSKKYGRPLSVSAQANPALLAGLRVRVGDDLYESSVSGQLAALASAV